MSEEVLKKEEFERMKREASQAREEVIRAETRRDNLFQSLRSEFGLESVEDAEDEYDRLDAEIEKEEAALKKAKDEYQALKDE